MFFVPAWPEIIVIREFMRDTGRLSTQKKSASSTALSATVLPEPDNPVMMSTREHILLATRTCLSFAWEVFLFTG
jgi:hypothetical protein